MYLAVEKNHCERYIGLSPNGKATDSDSVIFKVRILVAQLFEPEILDYKSFGFFVSYR